MCEASLVTSYQLNILMTPYRTKENILKILGDTKNIEMKDLVWSTFDRRKGRLALNLMNTMY